MSNYWVAVSDIATLTGNNPYQEPEECIEKYKQKFFSPKMVTQREKVKKRVKERLNAQDTNLCDFVKKINIRNSNDVCQQISQKVARPTDAEKNDDSVTEEQIQSYVKSKIYCAHGKKYENHVFNWLSTQLNGQLLNSNAGKGKKIGIVNEKSWKIYGRVDGIHIDVQGNKSIVEIKNRQNRMFSYLPNYEKIQTQMYMHIFNIPNALHVQHFQGKYENKEIEYDEEFVNQIISELHDAITKIN
jgi:hypothetical protein